MPQDTYRTLPVDGKAAVSSKMIVFNALALAVGVAVGFGFQNFQPDPNIAPLSGGIIALIQLLLPIVGPIVNIGLRTVTRRPIVRFLP